MDRASRSQSLLKRSKNLSGRLGALLAFVFNSGLWNVALGSNPITPGGPPLPPLTLETDQRFISESAGRGAAQMTVTRPADSPNFNQPLEVSLSSSDATELRAPASVTLAAGEASATFDLDAVDDTEVDGGQDVKIFASATGFSNGEFPIRVTDNEGPPLTLTIAADSIRENAGAGATTATMTVPFEVSRSLDFLVFTSDATEATAVNPPQKFKVIGILPGQLSTTFPLNAVDDTLLDGPQTVRIRVSGGDFADGSDTVIVTDYETLVVTVDPFTFSEGSVTGATATVTRSNTDREEALVVTLTSSDVSEAVVPSSVTIPAGEASVTFAIHAVDDSEVDGNQKVAIEASEPRYVSVSTGILVMDDEAATLVLEVTPASIFENAGKAAAKGKVTRNTGTGTNMEVALSSSDLTEANVPSWVGILKGQTSAEFSISAVDDALLDGSQTVRIMASSDGFVSGSASLEVRDYETLAVTVAPSSISESAAPGAATGTVTRSNTDRQDALLVTLASSDEGEAKVPASVTIPANQAFASFPIDPVDDQVPDKTQRVTITATALGYVSVPGTLAVTDDEPPSLLLFISPSSFSESAGHAAAKGSVTRDTDDRKKAVQVKLTSDDTSETTVPSNISIASGQDSAAFEVSAVDDDLLDGQQAVRITASAAGFFTTYETVIVTDHETLTLEIQPGSFSEGSGVAAAVATVTRSNTDRAADLLVSLSSGDASELSVPASVVIRANEASAAFTVTAVDDSILDGTQQVTITARATGYEDGKKIVSVTDNDLKLEIAADSIAENAGAAATTATVTRDLEFSSKSVTVSISSGDESEVRVPAAITIPPGEASLTFEIEAVDDNLLDGTVSVTLTASAGGFGSASDTVQVADHETISFLINAASVSEAAGPEAAVATVELSNVDRLQPVTVTLTSSDTTEAAAPSSVTIPAGARSISFFIAAVDDGLVDGPKKIDLSAFSPGYVSGQASLVVTDDEVLTLTLQIAADSIREDAGPGATNATLERNTEDNSQALAVTLSSSDETEATVTGAVKIQSGNSSILIRVDAVDDRLLDGSQNVTLTASAVGFLSGSDSVIVTDHEFLEVAILATSVKESAGAEATVVTITRSNTDIAGALVVNLASSDETEAAVPPSVTIPANESSVSFSLAAVDDLFADGSKTVTVTASAEGYESGSDSLEVTDDEVAALVVTLAATLVHETDGNGATTGTVTRNTEDNSGALVVTLSSSDVMEARVPSSVTILAGQTSASFAVDAVDDHVHDPTARVTITASAQGFRSGSAALEVTGECGLEVVTPDDHGDWFLADANPPAGQFSSDISFVAGPATPPLGTCSLRLETGPGTGTIGGVRQGGKPSLFLIPSAFKRVDSIKALSYSTYIASAGTPNLAPYLNIAVRNSAGRFAGTLVLNLFIPPLTSAAARSRQSPLGSGRPGTPGPAGGGLPGHSGPSAHSTASCRSMNTWHRTRT